MSAARALEFLERNVLVRKGSSIHEPAIQARILSLNPQYYDLKSGGNSGDYYVSGRELEVACNADPTVFVKVSTLTDLDMSCN